MKRYLYRFSDLCLSIFSHTPIKYNLIIIIILIFLSSCKVGDSEKETSDLTGLSGVWKLTMTTGNNTCGQQVGAIITDNIVIFQCDNEVQLIMGDGIWSTGVVDGKNIEFSNLEYHTDDGCESTHDMAVQLEGTSDNLTGTLTTNVSFNANSCGNQSDCMVETEIKLEIISHYLESCLDRDDFGNPSSSEYILPYPVGKSYKNNNSYCLPTGHREQQAYDFLIPIGETIIASRGGTVRQIKESSPDNGQGSDHNHIMIEHQDGTVGFYAHLKNNGVLVKVGDAVEAGDVIALAGHSGTTDVEHLHFGVYDSYPPQEGFDRDINFRNTDGPIDCNGGLVNGAFYTAL